MMAKDKESLKRSKSKSFFFFVLINTVSILFVLYLFEAFLRVSDPQREIQKNFNQGNRGVKINREGWGVLDGRVVSSWGVPVYFNDLGINGLSFRQKPFEIPKPKKVFRILVLGDSFSWGVGIREENRYSNLLEKLMNSRYKFKKFEVINLSILGFSTVEEKELLIRVKDIVEPDLIIVGFCINDPKRGPQSSSPERDNFKRNIERRFGPILKFMSKIGLKEFSNLIGRTVWKFAELINIIPTWQEVVDRAYNPKSKEWNDFLKALRDIKDISDGMGLPPPIFAVLNHGTSTANPTNYNKPDKELRLYMKWWHQAERAAKKRGFLTCNMEEEIKRELPNTPLGVNKWDNHPSEKLHEIYARKIFPLVCGIIENSRFYETMK